MNSADRIAVVFNRLAALNSKRLAGRPPAEQIVYYVVTTRCEIDINGFSSVYEQQLDPEGIESLAKGLTQIKEAKLAAEFRRGYKTLKDAGFYPDMNWNDVSAAAKAAIEAIGKRVGDQLWGLDEKLAALLDEAS